MEHTFTDANFSHEVLQSTTPVLVDFWAEWCGPCRAMAPIIEELADEIDGAKLKLGKLNVDQNPDTAGAYGIMSIPAMLVFQHGQKVDQFIGSMSKEGLKAKLAKYL